MRTGKSVQSYYKLIATMNLFTARFSFNWSENTWGPGPGNDWDAAKTAGPGTLAPTNHPNTLPRVRVHQASKQVPTYPPGHGHRASGGLGTGWV